MPKRTKKIAQFSFINSITNSMYAGMDEDHAEELSGKIIRATILKKKLLNYTKTSLRFMI